MNENRDSDTTANLEPDNTNAPDAKVQDGQPHQRVRIHIHSIRKRLADPDGISAKAVIDGIVEAEVIPDDAAQYVEEVTFSQEKGSEEKTVITITGADV